MKKTSLPIIIALIITFVYLFREHLKTPANRVPYPFSYQALDKVEFSNPPPNILIIGDQTSQLLTEYKSQLLSKIKQATSRNYRLQVISLKNHSLGRIKAKLTKNSKLPKIIIYLGGSSENFEHRYKVLDAKKISDNFDILNHTSKNNLISRFPILAKFFYAPVKHFVLTKDIIPSDFRLDDRHTQLFYESSFNIFEQEVKEWIRYVLLKGSSNIIITTPINFLESKVTTCQNAHSNKVADILKKADEFYEEGDYKKSLLELKSASGLTRSHAGLHHRLGKTYLKLSDHENAFNNLLLSESFDCKIKNTHPVYNAILKKQAKNNGAHLIDFNEILYRDLGRNTLFLGENTPQTLYIQRVIDVLAKRINELL